MTMREPVRRILAHYGSDNPGTKANLSRILCHGRLGGTGRLLILPVDQGFEHGPARSFAPNPPAYDPAYLFALARDGGLSAFAAPLGLIEAGADMFAGEVPLILKANNANSLARGAPDPAVTATVRDALRLGCSAKRIVLFSGGGSKDDDTILGEVRAIRDGGGHGSIIGRNTFQRTRDDALDLLERIASIYRDRGAGTP